MLISVGFVYAGIDDAVLSTLVFVLSLLLSLCLAYRMAYLCRMRYIISNEQLVFEHGVFHREVDYLELYRVVDFNESQTFMQQLFRLKTVSIFSGDRTTPRLDIIGVPMKENLVTTIRERVETSKRRRSIYEITNVIEDKGDAICLYLDWTGESPLRPVQMENLQLSLSRSQPAVKPE